MMNYGLDESQENAIRWAIERLEAYTQMGTENIESAQERIENLEQRGLTKEGEAYREELQKRITRWTSRREKWQAHKKTLEEMLP